jgi:hypothetical protein
MCSRSQNDSCGFEVTNVNWRRTFELMVKAKTDNLYDGDVILDLKLLGRVVSRGKALGSIELQTIQVSTEEKGLCDGGLRVSEFQRERKCIDREVLCVIT